MRISSFDEAQAYLAKFYEYSAVEYKLSNMQKLMNAVGNPEKNLKIVHVAGTSGKTSTAYYISSLLIKSGVKTGLTVSPHIKNIAERLQINGESLSESDYCDRLSEFISLIEGKALKPSWFEILVAFAYWCFDKERVDYAVVEVGLGGLKDATNVATEPNKICVITDIGLDHTHILGNSLGEIAWQKAGIIHESNQVFMYKQSEQVMTKVEERARDTNSKLSLVDEVPNSNTFMPAYQYRNWLLAKNVYEYVARRDNIVQLSQDQLNETMHTYIPGRMDVRNVSGKTLILDGAHNYQKMSAFITSFKKLYPETRPAVLLGIKEGKDIKSVLPLISNIASRIITTNFSISQDTKVSSNDAKTLAQHLIDIGYNNVTSQPDQKLAMDELLNGNEDVCLVTGSLYLIGQLQNRGLI